MIFRVPWIREKETSKILKEKFQISSKDCHCSECSDIIFKGDKYQYVALVNDTKDFVIFKTCLTCASLRKKFDARFGYLFDDVWSFVISESNEKRLTDMVEEELNFNEQIKLSDICFEKNWEEIRRDALWGTY